MEQHTLKMQTIVGIPPFPFTYRHLVVKTDIHFKYYLFFSPPKLMTLDTNAGKQLSWVATDV
jgi:hypothetical protein